MEWGLKPRGVLQAIVGVGVLLTVAACQSGDAGNILNVGGGGEAPKEKVTQSELLAYCPRVTLREGTAYFNTYAKGGDGDATKVIYQAAITDVTRNCTRANGMMTINVAAAGKIVPGPVGAPGNVTMPIRVAVLQGTNVLYSQLHKYQVAVNSTSAATQFVFNDPNVTIPIPSDGSLQVFVGYDEGPPAKKPANAF